MALSTALPSLSACYSSNVDRLEATPATGSDLSRSFSEEYRQLARYERDQMYDWRDVTHYSDKGLRAAGGEEVMPNEVESRRLAADKRDEILAARRDLVRMIGAGAAADEPRLAGRAQARLDCWMEQQEEGRQATHIAKCRDEFYTTVTELRVAMQPQTASAEPAPAIAELAEPQTFTFYLGFGRGDITPEDVAQLNAVADAIFGSNDLAIAVTGYADTVGDRDYNQQLSSRRAERVGETLGAMGVASERISIAARGEANRKSARQTTLPSRATGVLSCSCNRRLATFAVRNGSGPTWSPLGATGLPP